jgi:nicotinamidase-related amidase
MTTLTDRDGTALLVVDVQKDVVDGARDRDGVVRRIAPGKTAEVANAADVDLD